MKKIVIIVRLLLLAAGVLLLGIIAVMGRPHLGYTLQSLLGLFLVLYAIVFSKLHRAVHATLGICAVIPLVFVVSLMVYGNAGQADYSEDVVIVLGAGLLGDEPGSHLTRRLETAVTYLNRNPDAMVIVCGGLGVGRTITEAEAMERFLVARGIAPERIIQENTSTSTYENLVFAKDILEMYFPEGFRAIIVTNDFHIFRAASLARNIGIDAVALGAPTPAVSFVANYLREMLAIVNMWVFS